MAESYQRQDALAHRALAARPAASGAALRLWLEGPRTQLALRGRASDGEFATAVSAATGASLPGTANRASRGTAADLLWLGPDEWLVVGPEDPALYPALCRALEAQHALVSDVSSSRVILGLAGARARQVLAKGCSLDLHPRVFGIDHVASSALARAHALLHQIDDRPSFHLYVHRSFADYVFSWLADAAAEYDVVIG